jgi:AcrR family transcriptional regulator
VPPADGNHGRVSRPSLTTERIFEEALALVDEFGLNGLTTRALGRRLGVDPTAVYRHFRSKDELLAALADRIIGSKSGEQLAITDGDGSPRGQLRSACLGLRRALLAHPAMTPIAVRRTPQGANTWAMTEHALGLLHQAGIGDHDAARAYRALVFYTLGHAMLEAPYAALDPADAANEREASRLMYESLSASRYPNTVVAASDLYGSLDEQFAYGLDRLLDGLGFLASDRPSTTAATPVATSQPEHQSHPQPIPGSGA